MTEREATILSLVDQLTVERRSCADKVRALAVEHTRLSAALAAAVTLADHLNIHLPPDVFEADAPAPPKLSQDDPGAAPPEIPTGPHEEAAA
ncbi:MAG: hypothetical protein AAF753_11620 [Pseudomonadota bacterium]